MGRLFDRLRRSPAERGQVLALMAAGLAGFIAFVGLSVDMGQIVFTRTDVQRLADSAVLAGAQDLPNTSKAYAAAGAYADSAQFDSTTAQIQFSQTYSANDTIEVTVTRRVNYFFLRAVGLSGRDVSATATARVGGYSGGAGLLPWGFIASNNDKSKLLQNSCYLGQSGGIPQFQQNQPCTIKYGAGTNSGGDFGALSLGGAGAAIYRDNIKKGSQQAYKAGDKVLSETGDMNGPTVQGINFRFNQPPPDTCPSNDKSDVLKENGDGSVSIAPGCENSPMIGVIPVVDKIQNPQMSTILGFAFVFLTGTTGHGGSMQVQVEFVKYVTELPTGVYSGSSTGATMIKLIE